MKKLVFFISILLLNIILIDIKAQNLEGNPRTLRILTFNVYHGETMKGDFDLDLIANVINSCKPDLVALQEIDVHTHRSKQMNIAAELALRTKMLSYFGEAMTFDGGFYGVAILSRLPAMKVQNYPLPFSNGREPRTALAAHFVLQTGDTICFVSTHLDHVNENTDRLMQAKALNYFFLANKHPTILAGDLNDIPSSETIEILLEQWQKAFATETPTAPAEDPKLKIDYILFRPTERWQVIETKVIDEKVASDHLPVLSILSLMD